MSQQFYRGLSQLADRAMKRFGIKDGYQAYIRRGGTDYAVTALEAAFDPKDVDGVIILRTDTRFLLSTVDMPFVPDKEQGDVLVIKRDGESEEEVWLLPYQPKRIAPGGPAVFYELHCRTD